MKLYRVTLQGMRFATGSEPVYGSSFVVADNPTEAENIVKGYLEKRKLGFKGDRELDSIVLLAEESDYPDCKYQLFIKGRDYETR